MKHKRKARVTNEETLVYLKALATTQQLILDRLNKTLTTYTLLESLFKQMVDYQATVNRKLNEILDGL